MLSPSSARPPPYCRANCPPPFSSAGMPPPRRRGTAVIICCRRENNHRHRPAAAPKDWGRGPSPSLAAASPPNWRIRIASHPSADIHKPKPVRPSSAAHLIILCPPPAPNRRPALQYRLVGRRWLVDLQFGASSSSAAAAGIWAVSHFRRRQKRDSAAKLF